MRHTSARADQRLFRIVRGHLSEYTSRISVTTDAERKKSQRRHPEFEHSWKSISRVRISVNSGESSPTNPSGELGPAGPCASSVSCSCCDTAKGQLGMRTFRWPARPLDRNRGHVELGLHALWWFSEKFITFNCEVKYTVNCRPLKYQQNYQKTYLLKLKENISNCVLMSPKVRISHRLWRDSKNQQNLSSKIRQNQQNFFARFTVNPRF